MFALSTSFTLRNCEVVDHFCAFGSDGHGGCRKPGEAAEPRRAWLPLPF